MAKRATVSDLLTRKKPVTREVQIVLDGALADEWNELQRELDAATLGAERADSKAARAKLSAIQDRIEALRPKVEETTVEMVVQSIGRRAYDELIAEHPATTEQRARARKADPRTELSFDIDTFPAALLSASLIEPKMSLDEVNEMMDAETYNAAELTALIAAAMEVNQTSKVVALGKD